MGAFEYGQPLPEYGPRIADLSASAKWASQTTPAFGESVTYTVLVRSDGFSLPDTIYVTDTVPAGLSYVAGTLTATLGTVNDGSAPALYWSVSLGSAPSVTVTYVVTVAEMTARAISNTAIIDARTAGSLTRSATVIVNGDAVYLPVIVRSGR